MKKLLIYGAGAIGRGYLPWVFKPDKYELYYVEKNPAICRRLKRAKSFTAYKTVKGKYQFQKVKIADCFKPGEELKSIKRMDAILVAVGPRNFMSLRDRFANVKLPILCFENDANLPELMRKATGNDKVVFGIPDVITSNTAPKKLLKKDPLSIVTEDGVCFIDEKVKEVGGEANYVSFKELQKQWLAKLYIHNTPHCVTAYFGSLLKADYVHESMQNQQVVKIVKGIMKEMEEMLLVRYHLDRKFLRYYAKKELQRFSNPILFDPISRVAREPFRKLAPSERLIGAAQLCLSAGVVPKNLILGIMAAFRFENEDDPDFHIKHLINALQPEEFLRIIIDLHSEEALFKILIEGWQKNNQIIERIKNEKF